MADIELECVNCKIHFLKCKSEYNRQIRRGSVNFFCTGKCSSIYASSFKKANVINFNCLNCGKLIQTTTKKRAAKTCSIQCAGKYSSDNLSPEQKIRRSEATKKSWENGIYDSLLRLEKSIRERPIKKDSIRKEREYKKSLCVVCSKEFPSKSYVKKTCSENCYRKLISINSTSNPNCGGETNYKKYQYKDVTMDSSWEVEIAKFFDYFNIKWERSRKMCFLWTDDSGKKRRYYPDFYLTEYNLYIDPKNKFLMFKDEIKLLRAAEENCIKILAGSLSSIKNQLTKYIDFPIEYSI